MATDEEQIFLSMCRGACAAVCVAMVNLVEERNGEHKEPIPKEPASVRDEQRHERMMQILDGPNNACIKYLRMRKGPFLNLARKMREGGLLRDTIHVPVEQQLAMFLHTVGHKKANSAVRGDFIRSGETVSRYFNSVLSAICQLRDRYMRQAPNETPAEIANNPDWFPYFEDCIGMIEGTHVEAMVPSDITVRFRGRRGVTQSILAAATPNKHFTYIMAGWEGSVDDFTVLKSALKLPPPGGLRVYEGKYYLCDAGYPTMPGFITPYHGVRYHLKEYASQTPVNRKELFNLRHSSLHAKIEDTFGLFKNRFKIFTGKPHHPWATQVDLVLACAVLHNYILTVDPNDLISRRAVRESEEDGDVLDENDASVVNFIREETQREQTSFEKRLKGNRETAGMSGKRGGTE